jgi:hypothetical protein
MGGRSLGRGGGGVLLEPLLDLARVAAEEGAGLADVGGEEQHPRAHSRYREEEVCQRHLDLSPIGVTAGGGVWTGADGLSWNCGLLCKRACYSLN